MFSLHLILMWYVTSRHRENILYWLTFWALRLIQQYEAGIRANISVSVHFGEWGRLVCLSGLWTALFVWTPSEAALAFYYLCCDTSFREIIMMLKPWNSDRTSLGSFIFWWCLFPYQQKVAMKIVILCQFGTGAPQQSKAKNSRGHLCALFARIYIWPR